MNINFKNISQFSGLNQKANRFQVFLQNKNKSFFYFDNVVGLNKTTSNNLVSNIYLIYLKVFMYIVFYYIKYTYVIFSILSYIQ